MSYVVFFIYIRRDRKETDTELMLQKSLIAKKKIENEDIENENLALSMQNVNSTRKI